MRRFQGLLAGIVLLLLFPTPLFAQATSTKSSNSNAALIGLGVGAGLVGISLLTSGGSAATSRLVSPWISFGGRVLDINYCANGAVRFTIKPAGVFPISYMWLPITRWNPISAIPAIPPFPAEQVIGIAAKIPYVCLGPGLHPLSFVGFPVLYMGSTFIP